MADQKSHPDPEKEAQIVDTQAANVSAKPAVEPLRISSAMKPDKTVKVPKFCVSMNAEPMTDEVIDAILANRKKIK